jgi:hypothetical protein
MAKAAVVLMTPDDEARLKEEFWQQTDGESEKEFTGQPRQNVLFEAGMALGLYEDRTVIVELGRLRPMSDTLGRHVVRMNGSIPTRQELALRLRTAGCNVNLDGTDWHEAGDFQHAIPARIVDAATSAAEARAANRILRLNCSSDDMKISFPSIVKQLKMLSSGGARLQQLSDMHSLDRLPAKILSEELEMLLRLFSSENERLKVLDMLHSRISPRSENELEDILPYFASENGKLRALQMLR